MRNQSRMFKVQDYHGTGIADAADDMPWQALLLLLLQGCALTPLLSMRCLRLPVYYRCNSLQIPVLCCIQ
jgi:hypothetical protein